MTQLDLPNFDTLNLDTIEPMVEQHIQNIRQCADAVASTSDIRWETLVNPLEAAENAFSNDWSPIGHLNAVKNTPELRTVYEACLQKISALYTDLGQHEGLFKAYQQLHDSTEFKTLDEAQQKIIRDALRDFRLSGIDLPKDKKLRFKAIEQSLSQLSTTFDNHVMDATDHWHHHCTDANELKGIPANNLQAAADKAKAKSLEGYLLGIDFPTYHAVMTYADNRALREQFYIAFCTRASDQGPDANCWDNADVICQILNLRQEQAELLGYANHAEQALVPKMAESTQQVLDFLEALAQYAKPAAQAELNQLTEFAQSLGHQGELAAWDMAYYSEQYQQKMFNLSQEALRPYFPIDRTLAGLFYVANALFGLDFKAKSVSTWHDDVRFFEVLDANGNCRGGLYLDLYARAGKRGGAWMDDCRTHWQPLTGPKQLPVTYLTCNFMPPVGEQPAQLTHDDVVTLFHEFGHCLHHLMSQVDYRDASGIHGVAWDAVELPSQFMENFCWQTEVMPHLSQHVETGVSLPQDLLAQLQKSRRFQTGLQTVRQLEFALFDFRLHQDISKKTPEKVQAILNTARQSVSVIQTPDYNRFQNSFSHIFAGGYHAGYYSYKWAEVLSADAFSLFEERGILDRDTGQAFLRCILEKGGSAEPMALFIAFRGRRPEIQALLKQDGLLTS